MGSTYWYYYQVNGTDEEYDKAEPYTTSCPLLPGQCVNILDVPLDGSADTVLQQPSSPSPAIHTFNPDDRYINPRPAPKPQLPRLITPSSNGLGTQKVKARLFGDSTHPATASGWLSEREALSRSANDERLVKSAISSPSEAVKSAFSFLKGSQSALTATPTELRRGRSKVSRPQHRRTDRSTSPGERLQISSPELTYRSDEDRDHITLLEAQLAMLGSPIEGDGSRSPYAPLRSHPVTLDEHNNLPQRRSKTDDHSHKRQSSETPAGSSKEPPFPLFRSQSSSERTSCNSHSAPTSYAYFDPRYPQRSISRRRAPSPLRTSISQDDIEALRAFNPPTHITEVDCEDLRTPRRFDSTLTSPMHSPEDVNEVAEVQTGRHAKSPSLDKELPPLPSYLVPSPLRIRTAPADPQTIEFGNYASNNSRFSVWTTTSAESEDDHEPETGSQGEISPTFSSIQGGSTGDNTPLHLSDREPPSLDDYFHDETSDNEDSFFNEDRPDLMALKELQELIRSPTRTTPDPTPQRPFTSPLLSRSREVLAMNDGVSFGDLTPTSTVFKQHDLSLLPSDREPVIAVAGESLPEQVAASRQLTQMEELMNEFDYLGGLLS